MFHFPGYCLAALFIQTAMIRHYSERIAPFGNLRLNAKENLNVNSELAQWPVQLHLVPAHAPYFEDAHLLIAADCVPFAYANFHQDLLAGKILLIGCPKLDDVSL